MTFEVKRYETRDGSMRVPVGDAYVGRSIEEYGEYSVLEQELLLQLVRQGDVVVEAGANIGAHTIGMARACAPALLYAFEPQQRLFQIMCANLVDNGIENVVAIPDACGAHDGFVTIPDVDYARPQNFGSVAVLEAGSDVPARGVRMSTIDGLGLRRCRLIKADVEGFERNVLRGAERTIRKLRPILYVENAIAEYQQEVISLIDSFDYRQWWHTPALFNAENFSGNRNNVFPGIISVNILALPREIAGGPPGPPIDPLNWKSPVPPMSRSDLLPSVAR